ncbi:MAG TPA: hypothetical protein VGK24_05810 [Candidatus Angelobacter sp.]
MPTPLTVTDVPLSLFSGLNTELSPSDLPEGVSPDNQDVAFLPGSVFTRPCLHKIITTPLFPTATRTYAKSYQRNNGSVLNLYLYSNGVITKEDPFGSPGVEVQIAQVAAGAYAQSVTAQGREYIAINDGLHGLDVPLQFDGTNIDRVSQDGPGAPPSVADLNATVAISSITPKATSTIASISETGTVVTVFTTTPHGLTTNDSIYIFVAAGSGYNGGSIQVQSVPSPTCFTYFAGPGLTPTTGGTVFPAVVTVVTATPHGLNQNDLLSITGNTANNYNNGATFTPPLAGASQTNGPDFIASSILSPTSFLLFTFAPAVGPSTGGTLQVGGQISSGGHGLVCMFLTRNGYITAPSPSTAWISAGGKQAQVTNIPIGPANVIARILAFTGSGGDNYFWIPAGVPGAAGATIINDNTTTSAIVDFADNVLFNATAIDIPGNNLFNLVVLGPCLGVACYSNRLHWWGERNTVQNLLNMGFEGGTLSGAPNVPLGWSTAADAVLTAIHFGVGLTSTGDGTGNARGLIEQSAFQDEVNIAILKPSTQYSFRAWGIASAANAPGSLVAEFFSGGVAIATASIPLANFPSTGGFLQADFNVATPAIIASDTLLRVYTVNQTNGQSFTRDDLKLIFTTTPFLDNQFRSSYATNLESYDALTGVMGPASDPNPIRCPRKLRDQFYIITGGRLHQTQDNAGEPSTWQVREIEEDVGGVSSRCADGGESWFVWAVATEGDNDEGGPSYSLRIFDGGSSAKISQEIQTLYDTINPAAQSTIWVKNNPGARRIYVGVPDGSATAPNLILPLDYRELDSAPQIGGNAAIRISFTGKMIASDLARKWSKWNVLSNAAEILVRGGTVPNGVKKLCVCGGNGVAPGQSTVNAFGNVYFFDALKLTDDDYGVMSPYYITYFFVNHDMEQQLGIGSHRKQFGDMEHPLTLFVSGVGLLTITPLLNTLTNAQPAITPDAGLPLSQAPTGDTELQADVTGERVAFKISVAPLPGTTDVQFNLQKMVVPIMRAMLGVRGT